MRNKRLIKNATLINRGKVYQRDILLEEARIKRIDRSIPADPSMEIIDAEGLWALPGLIDDQVHFREPGLTHKANIFTESRAAVTGGVTSFMEMPNTKPPVFTQELLQNKYDIAAESSAANYSFYMGASNDNLEDVLKTDRANVCGVKIFMGSSTGNLLVDDEEVLDKLFRSVPLLIATHCEDEQTIRRNLELAREKYGTTVPPSAHQAIRSREACYLSSSKAVEIARKHGTRLHVLHISTCEELALFSDGPRDGKRITAEACVHHMTFNDKDYLELGNQIKCNPAIKLESDRAAIVDAVQRGKIDIIATDHAPHTVAEKQGNYFEAPSGLPLVEHALHMLLQLYFKRELSMEVIVDRACHAPADCYQVHQRGYLDEEYYADIVLIDPEAKWVVSNDEVRAKCGWTPLAGMEMQGKVVHTIVNGSSVYRDGQLDIAQPGMRLAFDRD